MQLLILFGEFYKRHIHNCNVGLFQRWEIYLHHESLVQDLNILFDRHNGFKHINKSEHAQLFHLRIEKGK